MSTEYLKIILDLVILAGLGGFMYYALRLSKALNAFRASRAEFNEMMRQLNYHIAEAQNAITELKESSGNLGDDLFRQTQDAQQIADELQLITKSGDNLASRLESLVAKNRRTAQTFEAPEEFEDEYLEEPAPAKSKAKTGNVTEFTIQDREYDDEDSDDPAFDDLTSAAEKELYKALKQTKN